MLSVRTSSALEGISKATLKNGVRVKHLFRIMTHYPDLWMQAYANIYANRGAITKGVDETTLDGMSNERVNHLIHLLKSGEYEPKPARRTYIPKANGKLRPLGVPNGNDKLVQEVMRMLLESIYEPVFSEHSHGFRPNRSCHTALLDIGAQWKGVKWIVDMDIKGFFDNIDHEIMIECLRSKIDDEKFIGLVRSMLKAGYLDDFQFHNTYSGTPQGGIVSPLLANVVLHELDQFMQAKQQAFNKGEKRRKNRDYWLITKQIAHWRMRIDILTKRGVFEFELDELRGRIRKLEAERLKHASVVMDDENYRRFHYIRYADDFAIGLVSSREEATTIYQEIEQFLKEKLKLEVAHEKSGIRALGKEGFDFLGYHLSVQLNNKRIRKVEGKKTSDGRTSHRRFRSLKSQIMFQVPKEKVQAFCRRKGYLKGKWPEARGNLLNLSDYEIVSTYNAEMRGFINYYALAPKARLSVLEWIALQSLFKTLAGKHKTTVQKTVRKMKYHDDHVLRYMHKGVQKMLRVFKVKYQMESPSFTDREPETIHYGNRTEILERMNAGKCEYCGKTGGFFEIHHVRKLKDIKDKKNKAAWEIRMVARARKTMVLCIECHDLLHAGNLQGWKRDIYAEAESPVRGNVHAGFGGGHTSSPTETSGVKSGQEDW